MAVPLQDDVFDIKSTTQKFKKILKTRGLEGLRKELNDTVELWQNTQMNVAITGTSGAGKSTFINMILGLDEENEAPTGITETTQECRPYKKKNSNVTFWDLPGVGTPNFPRDAYAEKVKLKNYDFFILMTKTRFTENDAWLVQQLETLGKRFYFVRSHIGQDIRNYGKAHPKCPNPEKQLDVMRDDCEKHLKKVSKSEGLKQISVHVYLIDNFMCGNFDFDRLVAAFIRETEGEVNASTLVASLSTATQEIINTKYHGLFARIRYVSQQVGMNCTVDSAEREIKTVFEHESKFYREVFEIDDDTLKVDHDLFMLSELGTKMMTEQLKLINKRLITSRVTGLRVGIKLLKEKFKSELDDMKIPQQNYIIIVFELLHMYMKCMYMFASNLFQNIPIQFASMCTVKNK